MTPAAHDRIESTRLTLPSQDDARCAEILAVLAAVFGDETRGWLNLVSADRVAAAKNGLNDLDDSLTPWPNPTATADGVAWLLREADAGREVFFLAHLINARSGGRFTANAQPITALWLDDGSTLPTLPTTLEVETSPGRRQALFRLTRPIPVEAAAALNRRLAVACGGDRGACSAPRLLRLPGTPNLKYPARPTVRLLRLDPDRVYDPDQLAAALPPDPSPPVPAPADPSPPDGPPRRSDAEVLERARRAKNGARFKQLCDQGDWRGLGYGSPSEGDLAALEFLAYWTGGNRAQMRRLFLRSPLAQRMKARRSDYLEATITKAINFAAAHRDAAQRPATRPTPSDQDRDRARRTLAAIEAFRRNPAWHPSPRHGCEALVLWLGARVNRGRVDAEGRVRLNLTSFGKELGVTRQTVRRYVSLLERAGAVARALEPPEKPWRDRTTGETVAWPRTFLTPLGDEAEMLMRLSALDPRRKQRGRPRRDRHSGDAATPTRPARPTDQPHPAAAQTTGERGGTTERAGNSCNTFQGGVYTSSVASTPVVPPSPSYPPSLSGLNDRRKAEAEYRLAAAAESLPLGTLLSVNRLHELTGVRKPAIRAWLARRASDDADQPPPPSSPRRRGPTHVVLVRSGRTWVEPVTGSDPEAEAEGWGWQVINAPLYVPLTRRPDVHRAEAVILAS